MPTIYEPSRQDESDLAHLAARRDIYPRFFGVGVDDLEYETYSKWSAAGDPRARVLDADLSIDTRIGVTVRGLRRPLPFYIQERFRDPAYLKFGDVTITEWSNDTDQPNELYKIAADYFTYGYYDKYADQFLDWVVFNVPSVKRAIVLRYLRLHRAPPNGKRQEVVALKLPDLERYGMRRDHAPVEPGLAKVLLLNRGSRQPSSNGAPSLFKEPD
jgi:hypothetical protein